MPVKPLPQKPSLDHLKSQARDLMREHQEHAQQAAQRIREFHPGYREAPDETVFGAPFHLSDAQLTIARERGFASWARLKRRVEKPSAADDLSLPHHERIVDEEFRRAVELLDAGDADGLHDHLRLHPGLARQRVTFEGGNYFQNPGLLEFIAENPIRRGTPPPNVASVARVILDAGAKKDADAVNGALGLVCSGCVVRECGVQDSLIDLLCEYGADPASAMHAALAHGEFQAVTRLIGKGARADLPAAAALGWTDAARDLLPGANGPDRHRALALASQFGHAEIVEMLLDAGEDPNRYNPVGFHGHSTPLHQAAVAGHEAVVRVLVERGARLDVKDTIWQGTPEGWAEHGGKTGIAEWLRARVQR